MATVDYPSGWGWGLAQGLSQGIEKGIQGYDAIRQRNIQDLLLAMELERYRQAMADRQAKLEQIRQIGPNLSVLAEAARVPPSFESTFQVPMPATPLGPDVIPPPTAQVPRLQQGIGEEAAGVVPPPILPTRQPYQVTIPAYPTRQPGLYDIFQRPEASKAAAGLMEAGVPVLGTGGLLSSMLMEEKLNREEAQRAQAGREGGEGLKLLITGKTEEDQAAGLLKMYNAGTKMGKVPDMGDALKYLQNREEMDHIKEVAKETGPIMGRVESGEATLADMNRLNEIAFNSKSPIVRQFLPWITKASSQRFGPGARALALFSEIQAKNPSMPLGQIGLMVAKQEPKGWAELMAEGGKNLPPGVKEYWQAVGKAEAEPQDVKDLRKARTDRLRALADNVKKVSEDVVKGIRVGAVSEAEAQTLLNKIRTNRADHERASVNFDLPEDDRKEHEARARIYMQEEKRILDALQERQRGGKPPTVPPGATPEDLKRDLRREFGLGK